MARRVLAVLVLLDCVLAVGCGRQEPKGRRGPTVKTPGPAPVAESSGTFVAIGDGRSLYMACVGSGNPTVVLEAGFGADTLSWQDVQPEVGRGTRTCAYDRAGAGNSVAPPGVRDARDEIADLRRLLARARVKPPYVLVGHSYGGVLARVFATCTHLRRRGSSSSTRWAATDDDGSSPSGRDRRRWKSVVGWRPR